MVTFSSLDTSMVNVNVARIDKTCCYYLTPASRTRTVTFGFSVNRLANASPAVPATLEL